MVSLLAQRVRLELAVSHLVWNLDLFGRHLAGAADVFEILLRDLLLKFGTEGNLGAEGAVVLVGSSVARIQAVGFLARLLGWVASKVVVQLRRCVCS